MSPVSWACVAIMIVQAAIGAYWLRRWHLEEKKEREDCQD